MHLRCIRTSSPWVKQQGAVVGLWAGKGTVLCAVLLARAEQHLQDKVCILKFSPGCLWLGRIAAIGGLQNKNIRVFFLIVAFLL